MSRSLRIAVGLACSLTLGCTSGAVTPRHAILTGVVFNMTKQPQSVTENPIEPAAKEGESCAHAFAIPIIWISFAFGNASAKKASVAAPTDRVSAIDRSSLGVLGLYANSCTLVTPGGKAAASEPPPAASSASAASASSSAPASNGQPEPRGVSSGDPGAWPASVPIADRRTCSLVCVAKEGAAPRESDKAALSKALDKHLGALRACVGGGKSAAGAVVSFDSVGKATVNYSFGARATSRADCPGSFPPVKNVTGPANATWQCTDYCE